MKKNILSLFGIVLLVVILVYLIDVKIFWQFIRNVNWLYLIPIFLLSLPLVGCKARRWQNLMRAQGINYNFKTSFAMYAVGILLSIVTPGKIGEAAKIIYLKNAGHSLNKSLVTIVADRLLDVCVLILFLFIGFIIFIQFFMNQLVYLSLSVVLSSLAIYLLIRFKIYLKIIKFFVPSKYASSILKHSENFIEYFRNYNLKNYLSGGGLTVLAWLIYTSQIYLLILALNISISFLYLVPMVAVANAVDALPISFNGLGTREAIFIFFFGLINLSAESATALGVLQLTTIISTSLIGFYFWLKNPIKLK